MFKSSFQVLMYKKNKSFVVFFSDLVGDMGSPDYMFTIFVFLLFIYYIQVIELFYIMMQYINSQMEH